MEEANMCGVNRLDVNARLPPRKRLLAGLKYKFCDPPSPSSSPSSISSDFSNRLRELLSSSSRSSNPSPEEIVDASRSAAVAAAKVAAAAKAVAEEKAAIAAKAVAVAKSALELVASFSENKNQQDRCLRKSKPKKQVPVKLLYRKRKLVKNHDTDEELAHRLHRAINSSPRISKHSVTPDSKIRNNKKHRKQFTMEKTRDSNVGGLCEVPRSTCNSNAETGDAGNGVSMVKRFDASSEYTKANCSKIDDADVSYSKGQTLADTGTNGRKRGRIKQKKLLLSLCAIRDGQNAKEEPESRVFASVGEPKGKYTVNNLPFFSMKPSSEGEASLEPVSKWKFKDFKASQCHNGSDILHPLCSNPTVTTGSSMIEVDQ